MLVTGTTMETLKERFDESAGCDSKFNSPGVEGVVVLFSSVDVGVEPERVAEVMQVNGWAKTHSFLWSEFLSLAEQLGSCPGSEKEETREDEALAKLVDTIAERIDQGIAPAFEAEECLDE